MILFPTGDSLYDRRFEIARHYSMPEEVYCLLALNLLQNAVHSLPVVSRNSAQHITIWLGYRPVENCSTIEIFLRIPCLQRNRDVGAIHLRNTLCLCVACGAAILQDHASRSIAA